MTLLEIFLQSSEWDQSTQNFMLIQLKNVRNRKIQKTLAQSILRASIVQVYCKKTFKFPSFSFMTFFQAGKNSGVQLLTEFHLLLYKTSRYQCLILKPLGNVFRGGTEAWKRKTIEHDKKCPLFLAGISSIIFSSFFYMA